MKDLQQALNKLIEISIDGDKGYSAVASQLKDTDMQTMFNRFSQQRKLFVEELKEIARNEGIVLDETGSVPGFFHRTWLNTKAVFSSDKVDTVIESAIEGDSAAAEVYTETISMEMPKFIREKLEDQLNMIKVSLHQLHGLLLENA